MGRRILMSPFTSNRDDTRGGISSPRHASSSSAPGPHTEFPKPACHSKLYHPHLPVLTCLPPCIDHTPTSHYTIFLFIDQSISPITFPVSRYLAICAQYITLPSPLFAAPPDYRLLMMSRCSHFALMSQCHFHPDSRSRTRVLYSLSLSLRCPWFCSARLRIVMSLSELCVPIPARLITSRRTRALSPSVCSSS